MSQSNQSNLPTTNSENSDPELAVLTRSDVIELFAASSTARYIQVNGRVQRRLSDRIYALLQTATDLINTGDVVLEAEGTREIAEILYLMVSDEDTLYEQLQWYHTNEYDWCDNYLTLALLEVFTLALERSIDVTQLEVVCDRLRAWIRRYDNTVQVVPAPTAAAAAVVDLTSDNVQDHCARMAAQVIADHEAAVNAARYDVDHISSVLHHRTVKTRVNYAESELSDSNFGESPGPSQADTEPYQYESEGDDEVEVVPPPVPTAAAAAVPVISGRGPQLQWGSKAPTGTLPPRRVVYNENGDVIPRASLKRSANEMTPGITRTRRITPIYVGPIGMASRGANHVFNNRNTVNQHGNVSRGKTRGERMLEKAMARK